jgi:hypothetical protein
MKFNSDLYPYEFIGSTGPETGVAKVSKGQTVDCALSFSEASRYPIRPEPKGRVVFPSGKHSPEPGQWLSHGRQGKACRLWTEARDLFTRIGMPPKVKQLQDLLDGLPAEG